MSMSSNIEGICTHSATIAPPAPKPQDEGFPRGGASGLSRWPRGAVRAILGTLSDAAFGVFIVLSGMALAMGFGGAGSARVGSGVELSSAVVRHAPESGSGTRCYVAQGGTRIYDEGIMRERVVKEAKCVSSGMVPSGIAAFHRGDVDVVLEYVNGLHTSWNGYGYASESVCIKTQVRSGPPLVKRGRVVALSSGSWQFGSTCYSDEFANW